MGAIRYRLRTVSSKALSFLKSPHIPCILDKSLRSYFPKLHRVLKYRTLDATSKKYWDGVWREEGSHSWRTYPRLFSKILDGIESGSKILDVGCGPGILLNRLRTERRCECYGLDISSTAMKCLWQMGISGVVACLPEIPFKKSVFDTVIATEVIEHLTDPSQALNEMKRVVRTGGLLICSVPNGCMSKEECDEHLHDFNEESFARLLNETGKSEIIHVEDKGGPKLLGMVKVGSEMVGEVVP